IISLEKLKEFVSKRRKNLLYTLNGKWEGLALLRLIDLDYFIRTMEALLPEERDLSSVAEQVKRDYGIQYETL
ncbi:MAG: hypothetical protein N3C13_06925, partial [Aquificaceae bacterium]|nr:hypothetical protein [Aquificaceae bacterium]